MSAVSFGEDEINWCGNQKPNRQQKKQKKKRKKKAKKKRLLLPEDLLTTRFITLLQTVLKSFVLMVTGL